MAVRIPIDECKYTSCYCEENVYQFISAFSDKTDDIYAVFVSNKKKQTLVWHQKTSSPSEPVCWDYHVICVARHGSSWFVYDLDTTLSFPSLFHDYLKSAFRPDGISPEASYFLDRNEQYFRPVPGQEYLKLFSSDRRHMKGKNGASWLREPPSYPAIFNEDLGHNLDKFLSFRGDDLPGKWVVYDQFHKMYSQC